MKKIDTDELNIQIQEDDVAIDLTDLEIYVEIENSHTRETLKSFKTPNWTGDVTGDEENLIVDVVNDYFTIFVTGSEVDIADEGKYDIHTWYYADNALFPDSKRRRHTWLKEELNIIDHEPIS